MSVTIVEADLRRPVQAGLLGVDGSRGLVDVLSGACTVREAMQEVSSPAGARVRPPEGSNGGTMVAEKGQGGSVSLLPSGGTVANPPAILAGRAMPELLRTVADHFDQVLVDVPPPLQVSDALPLLAIVDGIVIVARIGHTVEPSARRLVEMLARSQHAPIVGIVATDAAAADIEAFGVTSAYEQLRFRG
jgi:Mrp family chromosome partitioning ATPase